MIGDLPIRVPYVALPGYTAMRPSFDLDRVGDRKRARERLELFRNSADRQETAPVLDKLEIRVRAFGWNDFEASFRKICSLLKAHWSRSVCDDPWAPLAQALPRNRFYLADDRALAAFDNHWTAGWERIGDRLRAMKILRDTASIECDRDTSSSGTRSCTAAIRLSGRLIAVWTVWKSRHETPLQMAERESIAIQAYVKHAVSVEENFDALVAAVCSLRAPGSADGPNGPNSECER